MRRSYPESGMMRLGGPLMLAFFPQDVFFSINNDVVASLLFGVAFLLLMKLCLSDSRSYILYALSGLTTAVAFWAKFSNIAVLFVAAIIFLLKGYSAFKERRIKRESLRLLLFAICILLPIALILIRNHSLMGDFTGSTEKMHFLGWSPKPLSEMWNHPIFTPAGLYFFLSETLRNFWRGEFFWHGSILSVPAVDIFYVISSIVFGSVSLFSLLRSRKTGMKGERLAQMLSFFTVVLSLGFLVSVSIMFDFGNCFYPSRESPYLVSGRLMAGALIPFIAIYLDGLRRIFPGRRFAAVRVAALLIICAVILGSEVMLSRDVFSSQYNWYHMWAGSGN
jgi:magnesium-transporting ATPase (P-type)